MTQRPADWIGYFASSARVSEDFMIDVQQLPVGERPIEDADRPGGEADVSIAELLAMPDNDDNEFGPRSLTSS